MRLRGYLAKTVLLGAFGVLVAVSGDTAAISANAVPEALLPPPAQIPFQQYRDVPHSSGYKAFAVEPKSGQWGQSTQLSWAGIAVDQAIKDCRRRSARDCRVYAVGRF